MLSGPVDLLVLLFLMALSISVVVKEKFGSLGRLCTARSVFLLSLCVVYLAQLVNCMLKLVAIWFGVVFGLLWNLMVLFGCWQDFWPMRPCIVFQRICVFVLWSQCLSRCSCHWLDL